MAEQTLLTSESVTEGHPDKMCDQISDAILDRLLAQDPQSRVACETMATNGLVLIGGEITSKGKADYETIARTVIREIGYRSAEMGIDPEACNVIVALNGQSPDIKQAVDAALEVRGTRDASDDELNRGAGDQGMMVGFACDETEELMPLTISLAHRLVRRLAEVRKNGQLPWLRPDGKSQVTLQYDEEWRPLRAEAIVISAQHDDGLDQKIIGEGIRELVIKPVVGTRFIDEGTKIYVNPSGRFVVGGPKGDAGLTGRKIIVDTYGGIARHGGGAFSGKDPTKVDRSGAYAARWVAKNIVAAGLARRCEVLVSYAIGVAHPTSISVETFGTGTVADTRILDAVRHVFDLRPGAIIRALDLRRPIYRQTAAYGHFGRNDLAVPWEDTGLAAALREAAGTG